MTLRNNLSLLVRGLFAFVGLRLVRLATNKVRGVEPVLDIKCLLRGNRRPLICDVGANDGETITEFIKHFPDARVIAFEPFQECYETLKKLFGAEPNVRLENCALGASQGTARLNVFTGNRMNSLLEMAEGPENILHDRFVKTGDTQVVVETLDTFCLVNNIEYVDVLKVDTQGYDLNVLKGAMTLLQGHRIKAVLLEINFVPMYEGQPTFGEIHGFLCSLGYRLVDLYNHSRRDGYVAWCDGCYVAAECQRE